MAALTGRQQPARASRRAAAALDTHVPAAVPACPRPPPLVLLQTPASQQTAVAQEAEGAAKGDDRRSPPSPATRSPALHGVHRRRGLMRAAQCALSAFLASQGCGAAAQPAWRDQQACAGGKRERRSRETHVASACSRAGLHECPASTDDEGRSCSVAGSPPAACCRSSSLLQAPGSASARLPSQQQQQQRRGQMCSSSAVGAARASAASGRTRRRAVAAAAGGSAATLASLPIAADRGQRRRSRRSPP